jgi:hypothetical protein
MANDTLQYQIITEKDSDINIPKAYSKDNRNNKNNNSSNVKVITALVVFEKGDSLKARFTFELSLDDDNNYSDDNNNNHLTNSKYNKIKSLHIQFIK